MWDKKIGEAESDLAFMFLSNIFVVPFGCG